MWHDVQQGGMEWYQLRDGKITASQVHLLLGKGRSKKWTDSAETYKNTKIAELLLKENGTMPNAISASLAHGIEYELEAKMVYEEQQGGFVGDAGFFTLDGFDFVGCSPDGFYKPIGEDAPFDRGIEIKCHYNPANFIKTVRSGIVPKDHMAQIQLNMLVTGFDKWDYVIYQPFLKKECCLYIIEVYADQDYQALMLERCIAFYDEVKQEVEEVNSKFKNAKGQIMIPKTRGIATRCIQ